ncbi:MAG: hypothetical protein ACT4OO_15015 [Nitrospiraceae bacterium]
MSRREVAAGLKELVEYGVIGLLLGVSLWAIGVAVERLLFYRRVNVRQFRHCMSARWR